MPDRAPTSDPASDPSNEAPRRPTVPDPFIPPLRAKDRLIDLMAEITGRRRAEVVERLRQEEDRPGSTVWEDLVQRGVEPYVWTDQLAEFYEQTDGFLYESLVWNVTTQKNDMRHWIAEFLSQHWGRSVKILMYGDGLGLDSYYLSTAGHDVSSFEVSQTCVQFAESIFAMGDVDVRLYRDAAELPGEHFDVVICLDVLEHVPDPPELVSRLSRCLRPNGQMIVHAPFFFVHPAVATHLRANRKYSGDLRRLYHPAGLELFGGRLFWDPIVLRKADRSATAPSPLPKRRWLLRASGMALAVGRYWSAPHSWTARCLTVARKGSLTED